MTLHSLTEIALTEAGLTAAYQEDAEVHALVDLLDRVMVLAVLEACEESGATTRHAERIVILALVKALPTPAAVQERQRLRDLSRVAYLLRGLP